MKATAVNLDYFTDLLEIKRILNILRIHYHYQSMEHTNSDAYLILCSINFS